MDVTVKDGKHHHVNPVQMYDHAGRDLGESKPTVNGRIQTDCKQKGI